MAASALKPITRVGGGTYVINPNDDRREAWILLGLIAYPAHCVPKTVKQCIQTQCPCLIATWLLFVRTIALLAVAIVLCAPVSAQGTARMGELSRWLLIK